MQNASQPTDLIGKGDVQPVLLIGAPRSGTQLVRDMIASLPRVATWPWNEMNFMWRAGNRSHATDELTPEMMNHRSRSLVRSWFVDLAVEEQADFVIDKTCQNCVRLPYVDAVLPEAKYIYLERHPLDVVPSMMQRWGQSIPSGELSRIRSIPRRDVPFYVARTLYNQLGLLNPKRRTVKMWGPRFDGLATFAGSHSLAETCAYQWRHYADACAAHFEGFDDKRLLRIQYEDLVRDPERDLRRVAAFLGVDATDADFSSWDDRVVASEPGAGGAKLGEHRQAVEDILGFRDRGSDIR